MKLRVKLLAYTPKPDILAGTATRACWSKKSAIRLHETENRKKLRDSLEKAIRRGHNSVMEHASFTFAIEGISRVCSHQLVRHRMASYSQQSQRHVSIRKADYVIPPTIRRNPPTVRLYTKAMENAWDSYKILLEEGVPPEDARFVLPNAAKTNIVVTMNARALLGFFELRCCMHAQWEIRKLACKMLQEVKKVAPTLFKTSGPPCVTRGICPEDDTSCKLYKKYLEKSRRKFSF